MVQMSKGAALRTIMNQVRLLMHKFGWAAGEIHKIDLLAVGKRAILEDLLLNGPQTIPQMAVKRPVSRQHILKLVRPLKQEGLVEYRKNPIHKRSFIVALTQKGEIKIEKMMDKENLVLRRISEPLSLNDMERTIQTLNAVKSVLEGDRFRRAVEKNR